MLDTIQAEMYRRALQFRQEHTHEPWTYDEFKQIVEDSWAMAW